MKWFDSVFYSAVTSAPLWRAGPEASLPALIHTCTHHCHHFPVELFTLSFSFISFAADVLQWSSLRWRDSEGESINTARHLTTSWSKQTDAHVRALSWAVPFRHGARFHLYQILLAKMMFTTARIWSRVVQVSQVFCLPIATEDWCSCPTEEKPYVGVA